MCTYSLCALQAVKEEIKNNGDDLKNALEAAKAATEQQLGGAATASGKRYDNAVKAVEDGIDQATTSANKKFGDVSVVIPVKCIIWKPPLSLGFSQFSLHPPYRCTSRWAKTPCMLKMHSSRTQRSSTRKSLR